MYLFIWLHLEKAMAPHSSTLAWKIPWTEEPGGLRSMGLQRVGHDWATSLSLFTFMHWRGKWQPTPVFFLENPREGGAWWAAVYGVAQGRTRLKRLSSSSIGLIYSMPNLLLHPAEFSLVVACKLSCPVPCGILVSWPGIELDLALEGEFLTTGPSRQSQHLHFSKRIILFTCYSHSYAIL